MMTRRAWFLGSDLAGVGTAIPPAHTPAMPRISHLGQHPQQPRLLFSGIPGQLNQVADSRVNQ